MLCFLYIYVYIYLNSDSITVDALLYMYSPSNWIYLQAVPGPGQYTIHSQFEHDDVLHDGEDFDDEEEEEHEKVAFGSREKVHVHV